MNRSEVLTSIISVITDELVVCNIGLPPQELFMVDDQPSNFYMLGTMGLCSYIGLGLALSQPQKVIAIEGDGSIRTNLGFLPTTANNVANNFVLFKIYNGSCGFTGDQPIYTGKKTSLAAVVTVCGCENVVECHAKDATSVLKKALDPNRMTVTVCKCRSGNILVVCD